MAGSELSGNLTSSTTKIECAVCLQPSVHPAELPCGHIFCYLCIKGIVNQGRRCAMCRQDIPVDYLDKPKLLNPMDAEVSSQGFEDGHLWFYEGHNGWWQYDERSSLELESAYQKGERCCDLLIAGFVYIADFDGMLQYRRNDPSRRRRIKRDLATTSKKGIAGLKATKTNSLPSSSSPELAANEMIQNISTSTSSPINLSNVRIFTSASSNSGQNVALRQSVQVSQRPSGLSQCSTSTRRPTTDSNTVSQTEYSLPYRNLNLDNVLHDSLDWTIEQIESLNLELLNDYEALFRDVNNYGQLQDTLTQTRQCRRRPGNYMSRYLNRSNPPSQSQEDETGSPDRIPNILSSSSDLRNLPLEPPAVSSEESNHIYSEPFPPSETRNASPPQPPPRIMGMSRSGSRTDSLRHPPES